MCRLLWDALPGDANQWDTFLWDNLLFTGYSLSLSLGMLFSRIPSFRALSSRITSHEIPS
jgi:hypothetical protein